MCNRRLHVNTRTMLIHVNNNKHRSWWPTLSRSATRISFANSRYLLPATKGPRIEIALEQIEDECAIGRDHNGRSVSDFVTTVYASSIFLRRKNIFGVRGCVTIMRICIHIMKKKNFPFVMEYAYPSWLIAPKTVTWSVTIWISGTCLIVTRVCKICRPWWLSKYRDNS